MENILLRIILFTSFISIITALEKTNVEFIRTSCSLTTYPTLCFNSLSSQAGAIQTSPKLLAQTALSVAAMKDCIDLLSDSVYELKKSLQEMSQPGSKDPRMVMSDIQTWVSSSLTDEDTCSEGFRSDPKMKSVVRGKIVNVAHLTSNALALINNYASQHGYKSSSTTLISALEKTNMEFIKTSCSLTTYPTLCFNSLSTRSGVIQTSPKLLAETALSVTLDTTRTTKLSMVKLSKVNGMTPREVSAMKDCIELLSDSVYELKKSIEEMSDPGSKDARLVISDIQTWVSSALTDEDTCSEGFANDPKMKNVVRGKIVNVAHLTSNALALINSYASLSE
ncbi:hypothetical protein LXL04_021726 [Taraxacum kok-saghyz]